MSTSNPACRDILASGTPLLDVRAPVEFAEGAFPGAVNLPLLLDDERAKVGTCYRRKGKDAAIALGHSLVSGEAKHSRVRSWLEFVGQHEDALIYCARGGLRSQIAADWLAEAGRPTERVPGGFKALRHEVLALLQQAADERQWLILGGNTGCGKTTLLREFSDSIDFEETANHCGSVFGGRATPQPSQISFENQLAVELLGQHQCRLLVEDEGRNLGKLAIPEPLVIRMRQSPVVVMEVPFTERVDNIVQTYVTVPIKAGESAADLCSRYQAGLLKLRKRLGDERWRKHQRLVDAAFSQSNVEAHCEWIAGLLTAYYDPMYEYQLSKKRDRVEFVGDTAAVRSYLHARD